MAFIIAIQPDSQQAATLLRALNELPDLEVVVVRSKDGALAVVDERVPDIVLVHPFFDPGDDEHLGAYLRSRPPAAHVQVLTIPTLWASRDVPTVPRLFERLRRKTVRATPAECDPRLFATDVVGYLSWANKLKQTVNERRVFEPLRQSDRRRGHRWSPCDLPWVASAQMPGDELAALVDLSSGGALIRTEQRPGRELFRSDIPQSATRRSLTLRLRSGEEVHIAGKVIRCCVAPREDKTGLYEVAFRFDNSADAYIPAAPDRTALGGDHEASTVALMVRPDRQTALPSEAPASVQVVTSGVHFCG
jgi:PilZ domain